MKYYLARSLTAIGLGVLTMSAGYASNCNCFNLTLLNKTNSECKLLSKPEFKIGEGNIQNLQNIAATKSATEPTAVTARICSAVDNGLNVSFQYTCGPEKVAFSVKQGACEIKGSTPKITINETNGVILKSTEVRAYFPDTPGKVEITLSGDVKIVPKSFVTVPHKFSSEITSIPKLWLNKEKNTAKIK